MYNKNNFIYPTKEFSTDKLTREEFFQKRIVQIKKIHPLQQLTLILFCNNPSTDYTPIIKILDQCNFKFIVLERNLFDRVLSSCIANITKLAHRWKNQSDLPSADSLGSISIDREVWIDTLFKEYQTTEYRKSLLSNYNCLTVRYENLIEDCRINNIPIIDDDPIAKTWNVEYKDVVNNITKLQEIYESFIKSAVPNYSQYYLKYGQ
jgi:hypothetical protein